MAQAHTPQADMQLPSCICSSGLEHIRHTSFAVDGAILTGAGLNLDTDTVGSSFDAGLLAAVRTVSRPANTFGDSAKAGDQLKTICGVEHLRCPKGFHSVRFVK